MVCECFNFTIASDILSLVKRCFFPNYHKINLISIWFFSKENFIWSSYSVCHLMLENSIEKLGHFCNTFQSHMYIYKLVVFILLLPYTYDQIVCWIHDHNVCLISFSLASLFFRLYRSMSFDMLFFFHLSFIPLTLELRHIFFLFPYITILHFT